MVHFPYGAWLNRLSLTGLLLSVCSGAFAAGPASIDSDLTEDLAKRLQVRSSQTPAASQAAWSRVQFKAVADLGALPGSRTVVPLQYEIAPMAILRTDTLIAKPEQLNGKLVCLAQGGNYAGFAVARFGAVEKTYPSLTDALVALRTGGCDAVVHDSTVLQALAGQPEWKKFAARLPLGESRTLAFVIPAEESETVARLKEIVGDWHARSYPHALVQKVASKVAADVHMAQKAPDSY